MELQDRLEVIQMIHEAKELGAQQERAKWENRQHEIKEQLNESDSDSEWVTTKEAFKIIRRTSYNTLMAWVEKGYIDPPKKIGARLYWKKSSLLTQTPNGK